MNQSPAQRVPMSGQFLLQALLQAAAQDTHRWRLTSCPIPASFLTADAMRWCHDIGPHAAPANPA